MQQMIQTLYHFILQLFTDPDFAKEHPDVKEALKEYGHEDITPEEMHQAMALVADELPPAQAHQLTSYLQQQAAFTGDSGGTAASTFNVNQGGSSAAGKAASAAPASSSAEAAAAVPGEAALDAVAREINYITNNITNIKETNTTNIDDRDTIVDNSVRQSINAGRDVSLDQDITNNTASGDGAVAGEVAGNVNTGQNSGIVGDAPGARVTNVDGDGNTVLGDIGHDANVVTGEVGQFVGGNVRDANMIGGDNSGTAVGGSVSDSQVIGGDNSGIANQDGNLTGATIGDGNTALAGNLHGNLNLGGKQTVVEGDGNNLGSGDLIKAQNAAVNTGDYSEAANATVGGSGMGSGQGAELAQVNVGSGDSKNVNEVDNSNTEIDHSNTEISQEATVNQVQNIGAGGGDAELFAGQEANLELEAGEEGAELGIIEVMQDMEGDFKAPDHDPMMDMTE